MKAKRGAETKAWSWVEALVWTDRMVSALGNGVKGGRWYSLMDKVDAPATLKAAWARVRANKGAAGIDGVSIERFEARAEHYLTELSAELREGRYRPQPVRRVEIPKGDGRTRPLGIPVVKDRIVRTAMKFVIEPIFEAAFQEGSYGFRPGTWPPRRAPGSGWSGEGRPRTCGRRGSGGLLRRHSARAADGTAGDPGSAMVGSSS